MEHFDKQAIDAKVASGLPYQHRWHNRFHLEMPFGLINDPNGLCYANGEYHIFYQWNPFGCEHKNKSWAHVRTRDFVHYSVPELALWPTDEHDKDGCYSGCGFVAEGNVRVFYTCNAKDAQGVRTSSQRFGTLQADGAVKKEEFALQTHPAGYTAHFRDPYLFTRHGRRYMVLGAQADEAEPRGTVLIYEETEAGWQLLGEPAHRLGQFGYMWECPNLLQFGQYDALLFCPQGLPPREFDRQNLYQAGYIAGHLSLDGMAMLQHTKFQELDRGFDFYAPQVLQHEGRHILFGWMGMPDCDADYPTREQGWQYSLTLPRELTLRQGHIYSQPARELKALRIQQQTQTLQAKNTQRLEADLYTGSEVLLNIRLGQAHTVDLTLRYGLEKTVLHYDRHTQVMRISREDMHAGARGLRQFQLYADEMLTLQLFIDRTAVEAFFQHGEEVASFFVFPDKDIVPGLELTADAPLAEVSGQLWALDAFHYGKMG